MGATISPKQPVLETVRPFQDVFNQVDSVPLTSESPTNGNTLYTKYEKEVMSDFNPLRFYNNFRLFYSIRKMEYSFEEMKEMQKLMQELNSLSWKCFNNYQESTKNPLFSSKQNADKTN